MARSNSLVRGLDAICKQLRHYVGIVNTLGKVSHKLRRMCEECKPHPFTFFEGILCVLSDPRLIPRSYRSSASTWRASSAPSKDESIESAFSSVCRARVLAPFLY